MHLDDINKSEEKVHLGTSLNLPELYLLNLYQLIWIKLSTSGRSLQGSEARR